MSRPELAPAVLVNVGINTFRLALNSAQWAHKLVHDNTSAPDSIVLKHAEDHHMYKDQPPAWYRAPVLMLAKRGNDTVGGFAIIQGQLCGLWGLTIGDWLVQWAIKLGAVHLDCFDTGYLVQFYRKHGFVERIRELNHTHGGPDVVFMRLP